MNKYSGIYGILFMRRDGSVFGALPYRNVFMDDPENSFFSDDIASQIKNTPFGKMKWIGPLTAVDLYGKEDEKYPDAVMLAAWKISNVRYGECYVMMLVDDSIFADYAP